MRVVRWSTYAIPGAAFEFFFGPSPAIHGRAFVTRRASALLALRAPLLTLLSQHFIHMPLRLGMPESRDSGADSQRLPRRGEEFGLAKFRITMTLANGERSLRIQ